MQSCKILSRDNLSLGHISQVPTSIVVKNLNSQTISPTSVSVVPHIRTTNNLVTSLTSTFLRLHDWVSALSNHLNISSKTVSVTLVQVVSSVGTTYWLFHLRTLTASKQVGVINFYALTKSKVLNSDVRALHHTLVSVRFVINSANWNIALVTLTVLLQ